MKQLIMLVATFFIGTAYVNTPVDTVSSDRIPASDTRTPQAAASCKYSPGDIASVTGHGSDIHKARSAASKICFEKRVDLFEKTRNAFPTTEQGQLIIDSCVNIKCS